VERLKDPLKILEGLKHSNIQLKICPKCLSTEIYPEVRFGVFPTTYRCKDCGYAGTLIIEVEPKEEE